MKKKSTTSETIDRKFDEGKEDIIQHFDFDHSIHRILVDFPKWMLEELDSEAKHLGISRQAVIKTWINDRIISRGRNEKAS